jgi:hypothetical protein
MLLVAHRGYILSQYEAVILQSITKQSIFVTEKPYAFCEVGTELFNVIFM